ncbi:DNA gyrase/topoisomerase IV subunit A [Rubinisphaera brasiliensis]|uniref:DNA topoisomerase (ATP-hydrolyzing) n=1 Tax=Rubinisphaera brasiliensis (strain ATCC 49424 / DSM 5305 / JCM 21570 / IAM 15109 / NBRC 103401 / IFAM 1448) TaxID=756272 RepID=F0SMG1_RUBBR|nr:DNA topoisomerase IV subunit A [Rubinisphaera brasiliensis]ADY57723.1 DNA topoisomerase (ATP-hydrolyzing) [Rubinisphaera brasiliensis DSM 5305]
MARSKDADTNGQRDETDRIHYVSLSDETRRRYLNYAYSVIQSRALPDVRDGLKPVQRRILYVMYHDLRLTADSKPRKCAKITGDTTGNYHPHGDASVYDALVRLAQDFTLREPLIDGQGNFGSIIGLPPAAARYTEAKLTPIAAELMSELRYQTVEMRENYDGMRQEPVVLPSRFPHLLVNGTQGIAVGMATSIPPHNLHEVVKACLHLIDNPDATVAQLMKYVKAPDFPLGGRIVTDRRELRNTYETGRGSIKVRGEWEFDKLHKGKNRNRLVITSIPYNVETGPLMTDLGTIAESKKLPQLVTVADESNEELGMRLVLEVKHENDAEDVMAFLYKHTALEQNFAFNATCLVPDEAGTLFPAQCNLKEMLQHFLTFRMEVVRKRLEFLLAQLEKRIHILEGFEIVFSGLDKALRLIRSSKGKADAAQKLMKAFPLDEIQTDAILEMALYRISELEIDRIIEELKEKRAEAERLRKLLASETKMWRLIADELGELGKTYGNKRRTGLGSSEEIAEFDPSAYIVKENTNVVLTSDGWIKRVGRIQSVDKMRVREGDTVINVLPASTLDQIVFFADDGTAYTLPIDQIPASSGYGEPLAKHIKLADGAKIVHGITTDPRFTPEDDSDEESPLPYLLIATEMGQVMAISFSSFRPPSTKVGRKYCRLAKGDKVVFVDLIREHYTMFLATEQARVIHFELAEVPLLAGPGRGVKGIKLAEGDSVLGGVLLGRPSDTLRVVNENGKQLAFGQAKYGVTSRGGKGVKTSTRTGFTELIRPDIELVDWSTLE